MRMQSIECKDADEKEQRWPTRVGSTVVCSVDNVPE
jgi:hypothetical protein